MFFLVWIILNRKSGLFGEFGIEEESIDFNANFYVETFLQVNEQQHQPA